MSSEPETRSSEVEHSVKTYQRIGRVAGPAIFVLMLAGEDLQGTMPVEAWRVAAVGIWMAVWWATEAIPVFVTAFLPIVVPVDASLVGAEVVMQGLVLDPGAGGPGPADIATSNGLAFEISP